MSDLPAASRSAPSFAALYDDWFREVSGWVQSLGAPEADRDDIVQEVFLVAYRRLADFDGGSPAGWLFQIARRKVRDHRRLVWVTRFFGRQSVQVREEEWVTDRSPLHELEAKQQRQMLDRLLGRLNKHQRDTFILFELEGHRGAEIAEMAGVPLNTVWQRLHKARRVLNASGGRTLGV